MLTAQEKQALARLVEAYDECVPEMGDPGVRAALARCRRGLAGLAGVSTRPPAPRLVVDNVHQLHGEA